MARAQRRRLAADTDSTVVGTAIDMAERLTATAGSLVGPLQVQLAQAQQDLTVMRERIATLEARAEQSSREYADCREREARTMARERSLQEEIVALRGFVRARRSEDLFPEPGARPPRREVWTEEQRAAHRAQQKRADAP